MNGKQIDSILRSDICARRIYQGVFARDQLPVDRISNPSIFVVNTDTHNRPGEHWIAIYFNSFGYVEYFDSFGLPPLYADIEHFIKKNTYHPYTYSTRVLQDLTSSACGLYVLYYVLMKSRGQSLPQLLRSFSSRFNFMNDRIVFHRVKQFYLKNL